MTRPFLLALAVAGALGAADNPFTGAWKLNLARSKFTGDTVKYESAPGGAIKETGGGFSYTFKTDGGDYPAPLGRTAAWKQLSDRSWETALKANGKVLFTTTSELSPDGKTLRLITKATKPNGEPYQSSAVYERIAGTSGLRGTWRSKEVKISAPMVLEMAPFESDGLTLSAAEWKFICKAKFDGKDYPASGPTVPAGLTLSLKRSGARSFEITTKQNGKPFALSTYTLSADGRTLTEVSRPTAVNEPVTAVYERQ